MSSCLGDWEAGSGVRFELAYRNLGPEDAIRSEHLARACNLRSARGLPLEPTSNGPGNRMPSPPNGPICGICEEPLPGTRRPNKSGVCTRCRDGMSFRRRRVVLAALAAQRSDP